METRQSQMLQGRDRGHSPGSACWSLRTKRVLYRALKKKKKLAFRDDMFVNTTIPASLYQA